MPDLAVEIVSPTNLAEEIDRTITEYFQAGVRLVWVFYPDSGRVYVYQSPTHVGILERDDTLDGGEVLPGFRLPIAGLYEAVARPEWARPWSAGLQAQEGSPSCGTVQRSGLTLPPVPRSSLRLLYRVQRYPAR